MGLLDRLRRKPPVTEEKGLMAGGYELPISGGFIPSHWPWNFWQQGRDPIRAGNVATVAACVDAYAHTLASMPAHHVRRDPDGGVTRIETSSLYRWLRTPNNYQTASDFWLNYVRALLYTGNAYAVAFRNDRNEIESMVMVDPRSTQPMVDPDSRAVFYAVGSHDLYENPPDYLVPARDVLHVRLHTPRHPLVGVSPIENLALTMAANAAITRSQAAFYNRMSRPSGVLSTEERLNKTQMVQLREAWESQSSVLDQGGVPILSHGIKWSPMSISSQDSQMVAAFKMSVEEIARAFRVPPPMIGSTDAATYSNVEQMISNWLSMGLGFHLNHIEQAVTRLFRLPAGQSCEFDADTLMRTDFAGRIDATAKAIQFGLYSPNEGRRREGLPAVPFGDEPRLQSQVVPLSAAGQIAPTAPAAPAAPVNDPGDTVTEEERAIIAEQKLRKMMTETVH